MRTITPTEKSQGYFPVRLRAGQVLTDAIDLSSCIPVTIEHSDWNGAGVTVQASLDGITFYDMYDDSLLTGSPQPILIPFKKDPQILRMTVHDWKGIRYIRFRSGTLDVEEPQAEDTTIRIGIV